MAMYSENKQLVSDNMMTENNHNNARQTDYEDILFEKMYQRYIDEIENAGDAEDAVLHHYL